ncbi:MAG: DNA polymerase III subunit delta' [Magnetococcales bacterium]|nr:DNA polymerase III subunit delta' [Magnetococcales bacterium]
MSSFPTFHDHVGHASQVAGLHQQLARGQLGHAYLFTGPAGVGKKHLALALAGAVFCPRPAPDGGACGACKSCRQLASGNHPDLLHLQVEEGRTRISIDQVRDLIAFLQLTPTESRRKIGLIDEVTLMNEQSANALLRTLEEPPGEALLFLVTERPGILLPTIRSRCQILHLAPLSAAEMEAFVAGAVDEAQQVTARSFLALAEGAPGRLRQWLEGDMAELWARWNQDLDTVDAGNIGDLCLRAEFWSQPERFSRTGEFLRMWLRKRIHALLGKTCYADTVRIWLQGAFWSLQLWQRSSVFNLNRNLVMECLFIHLARIKNHE